MIHVKDTADRPSGRVGLVLAGAVARGAYEAGAMSVLLPELEARGERPRVLVGTSSGGLNAAFLASRADEPAEHAAKELLDLWHTIKRDNVYRLFGSNLWGLFNRGEKGLVDTSPLEQTITDALGDGDRIAKNIRHGHLDALAVVATETATSRSTVFVEKRRDLDLPDRDDRKGIDYEEPSSGITARHLMASASVPMLFAPVNLGSDEPRWFVDGGVRLNTPIKPAISLGADKVVIVATNPACHLPPDEPPRQKAPDLDDTFLQFMQAAIADPLIEDVYRLARTNTLVAAHNAEKELESDWEGIWIEDEQRSIEPIPYLFVGPTERGVFGERAAEAVKYINASETSWFDLLVGTRRISQLLGTQGTQQKELLSYVLFDPLFADEAIELGREHAYKELHDLDGLNRDWRIGPIDCGTPARAKQPHMAGSGELHQRHDGKWAWRIKATNGQIVATDGGQGYEAKSDALNTLEKVISGHYQGLIKELD